MNDKLIAGGIWITIFLAFLIYPLINNKKKKDVKDNL